MYMQPLKVTKSLHACVNLNGMLVDGWSLYKLGIIYKEIGNDLLTCGNNLVSCGNDFLNCGNNLLTSVYSSCELL